MKERTRRARLWAPVGAALLSMTVATACGDTGTMVSLLDAGAAALTITVADDASPGSVGSLVLDVGDSVALAVSATNALGLTVQAGAVTWSSSNVGVATVSAGGVLRGVAPGTVDVVAAADGVAARVSATVTDTVTVFPAP